jgi:lycopene cyclase domain-containing protein
VSYTAAAALGVVVATVGDLFVLRSRVLLSRTFWATYPIIVVFQLASNGVLTGRGVVRYDPAAVTGVRIAYAPVEDLGFGFALVVLSLSLWVWWGRRGVQPARPSPQRGWVTRLTRRVGSRRQRDR